MPTSISRLGNALPFSKLFRQLETDMETVVKVLQPGPLGIIEHKFSAEEIQRASATVERAVVNWRRNAVLEQGSEILKDYIDKRFLIEREPALMHLHFQMELISQLAFDKFLKSFV